MNTDVSAPDSETIKSIGLVWADADTRRTRVGGEIAHETHAVASNQRVKSARRLKLISHNKTAMTIQISVIGSFS